MVKTTARPNARLKTKRSKYTMRWVVYSINAVFVIGLMVWSTAAEATEYIALHLYQEVQFSDAIVIGTVTDGERAMVSVNETLKGAPPRSFRLVEYVDGFMRPADQRPLITGMQELMFLKRKDDGYAPLQTQFGRWPIRNGRLETPWQIAQLGLPDYRKTIARLVNLQTKAERGGTVAIDSYIDGLQATDAHVRLWAAHTAYQHVEDPPARLMDAYLHLWQTGDGELRGSTANAVIKWKIRRAAPMLAATLREGNEGERATAARALGGTGDSAFLSLLRAAAVSDQSEKVRGSAYDGLTLLLVRESIPDLLIGANDPNEFVRRSVAIQAGNMGRTNTDPELRADVRRLLLLLAEDPAPAVKQTVRSLLKQFDNP
jgi:HEAT repeat protein